ncbi:Fe-Mn family superoxide dismutase [Novosphingobium sp.]|uniref:superoxide dismutase n=1 Tax=Novosphingobium sp. TaxID=1874826 RepID=UPI002B46500D|nr:Fe-Mn family superoxide dismutase [Novosphingobium sp.]HKR93056.1 Fe-Mn family superoxide dismutase [Novosphingobium sp.]
MIDPKIDRRDLLAAGAALTVSLATVGSQAAQAQTPKAAGPSFAPQPQPLPFDPKGIAGLSEKLLVSHHDNNYVGAVKRLEAISAQLSALDPATAPGFQLNGLKREELMAWNSMILHELYFSGLGAPNRPDHALAAAIELDFGSDSGWRGEFAGMGKALAGGSGWVVLSWSHRDRRLMNQWAADHTMALANATPILVLDMYEHAYAIDYGAKAAAYVDAFMGTVNWTAANSRFGKVAVT